MAQYIVRIVYCKVPDLEGGMIVGTTLTDIHGASNPRQKTVITIHVSSTIEH